jgi:hypothetical protein
VTTYRTGNHHGITICAEGDGFVCDRDDHDCARGHLVAVVVNGDHALAERICDALNAEEPYRHRCPGCGKHYRTPDAAAGCDADHRAHAARIAAKGAKP